MKLRPAVIALALAGAAALLLSGCESKTGTAAIVGDTTISVKRMNSYVNELDAQALAAAQFSSPQQQVSAARGVVLNFLISEEVTEQSLATLGVHPTDAELNAKHDDGLAYIFTDAGDLTGDAANAQVNTSLTAIGIDTDFASTVLRVGELQAVLAEELHISGQKALAPEIKRIGVDVRVSPRWGTWSSDQLSLLPGAVVPPFISSASSAAPAAG